jgi:hypothetical protein
VVFLGYFALNITINKHLMVKIKYVFQRGNSCYWQRQIPEDLRDRYPSSGPLKVNLKTTDPVVISSRVATLNRQHEALWASMRNDPTLTPVSARDEARKLLKSFGVGHDVRGADERNLEGFFSHLEAKREDHADRQSEPEEAYRYDPVEDYLSKPEIEALKMLKGVNQFLLSDAIELYLSEHPKNGQVTATDASLAGPSRHSIPFTYPPLLRMEGSTTDVTHFLNCWASALRLVKVSE